MIKRMCLCWHKEEVHFIGLFGPYCQECSSPYSHKVHFKHYRHSFKLDNLRYLEELSNGRE
jgi:hypothetical protein